MQGSKVKGCERAYPCEDGEEGEGNGRLHIVPAMMIFTLVAAAPGIGQIAESHKPQECPQGCGQNDPHTVVKCSIHTKPYTHRQNNFHKFKSFSHTSLKFEESIFKTC